MCSRANTGTTATPPRPRSPCATGAFASLGVNEVYAIIRDVNYASRRVAARLGMRPAGVMMKHYHGMDMPHIVYKTGRNQA